MRISFPTLMDLINIVLKVIMGLITWHVCQWFGLELWATITVMIIAVERTSITYTKY